MLGTSITKTFGTQMQFFCSEVLGGFGSAIPGIDLEFMDALDRRKKTANSNLAQTRLTAMTLIPLSANS